VPCKDFSCYKYVPGAYLPWVGIVIAFILPLFGAYSGASYSLNYLADGFKDFVTDYGAGLWNTSKTQFVMWLFVAGLTT